MTGAVGGVVTQERPAALVDDGAPGTCPITVTRERPTAELLALLDGAFATVARTAEVLAGADGVL